MEIPVRIYFVGNSPTGGKLRARFVGNDLPTAIQIKGTTDCQPVRLRKNNRGVVVGKWLSKAKYTSRQQTLQFILCGQVVKEAKYDSCGDLIVENPTVTINPTSSITTSNGLVNFVWTSVVEESVDQYTSEKKVAGASNWDSFDADEPTGAGSTYTSEDAPTSSASIDYRLRAIFMDGTDKVLLNQTLNVVVPPTKDVVVENFNAAFNPDTLELEFSWRSTVEVSLVNYVIKLTKAGGPTFDALTVSAVAALTSYAFGVSVDEGTYTAQLVGVFNDGSTKVAATKDNVVVPAP